MLDFFLKPLRSLLGASEREVAAHSPFEQTEENILDTVNAVREATDSIEHHVEVIETLATSVGPLTESVNRLTTTMADLVTILGPLAAAEHGVESVERHFFRRHRQETTPPAVPPPPAGEGPVTPQ